MRALIVPLLLIALTGCAASDRMVRAVPFWADDELPDPDRVNVWPLYYQTDDLVTVLWPIFDVDEEGFALRPFLARDGNDWSALYPLAGWNTEDGHWWVLPAYSFEKNRGFFPLWNFGEWNHVVLAWWLDDDAGDVSDWGVFPLFGVGEVGHVGPVWWESARNDEPGSWGIFPVAFFGERSGYFVPAWWRENENGGLEQLGVLPLFFYENDEGYERLITPLGGRSWGGDGEKGFVNVLGPVFHHSTDGERSYTSLAWPIFVLERDGEELDARVFPLFRYTTGDDASSMSMLAGLIGHDRKGENESFRLAPLFAYNRGMPSWFWDHFTLYGYRERLPTDVPEGSEPQRDVSMHIGTPLLFHYRRTGDRTEWGSLLNILDYEAEGDESSFAFLYWLYRQQREGEQVRRDFFPFFTWDSGPERSGFSFLWRVFRYERRADRTGGHILFIPWGDS